MMLQTYGEFGQENEARAQTALELAKALSSSCHIPQRLGKVGLGYKDGDFFSVDEEHGLRKIDRADVAEPLRGISPKNLEKFLKIGTLSINKVGDNDYAVKVHPRLRGGGLGGANVGMWIGRAAGYGIVFGGVAIVCSPLLLIPGAGPAAYGAAVQTGVATTAPVAEGLATTLSIAGGITGGVATGPV